MTAKKLGGLGRGLGAIYDDFDVSGLSEEDGDDKRLETVKLDELRPGSTQPRSTMTEEGLQELADSIRQQGIISPIIVRPADEGYEIIAGERRFRAARMAGLEEVPVIIRTVDQTQALAMALIENMQREDLNPLEEAAGIQRLIDECDYTHEQAAEAVGRSRTATTNLLRLLTLTPEVKAMLKERKLEMGHARALLALDAAEQVLAAKEVVAKALSVRQTEDLIRRMKESNPFVRSSWSDPRRHSTRGVARRDASRGDPQPHHGLLPPRAPPPDPLGPHSRKRRRAHSRRPNSSRSRPTLPIFSRTDAAPRSASPTRARALRSASPPSRIPSWDSTLRRCAPCAASRACPA